MSKKSIAFILIALAFAVIGYWAATSRETWTLQQVPETKVDPIFQTESIEWKDEFRLGLLDGAAPIAGVLIVIGATILWVDSRSKKRMQTA